MTQGGPAQPIANSSQAPDGGPALRVTIVSDGRPTLGGPCLPVVVVNDGRPTQGNVPIPVVYGSGPVAGGTPIPVVIVGGAASNPQLGPASVAALNTTVTNDLSPDGISWAAVRGASEIDAFGKIVLYGQKYNANTRLCYFVFSNDQGATWQDNTGIVGGEGFLVRGDIVYDAARDCFHGLIVTTNPSDGGIIYRRYSITRDGSNNITAIARIGGVSVVLDDAAGDNGNGLEFPTIIMSDANTLLAAWAIRTASGGEIRCAKCDISGNPNAGGTASNWVNIGVNSATTIGAPPAVGSYTIPFTQVTTAVPYFSLLEQANGDLRWVWCTRTGAIRYQTRRSIRNAANTWNSLSAAATLTNMVQSGTDGGYSDKDQLISQITEAAGVCFVGLAIWKSNALGDTWSVYAINPNDTVQASMDAYSANGAHSYAPTGDVAYDATAARLVVTYEQTATQNGYIGLLGTDLSSAQAFSAFETASDIDIPVIASTRVNGQVLVIWRVAGLPPQIGKYARLAWS